MHMWLCFANSCFRCCFSLLVDSRLLYSSFPYSFLSNFVCFTYHGDIFFALGKTAEPTLSEGAVVKPVPILFLHSQRFEKYQNHCSQNDAFSKLLSIILCRLNLLWNGLRRRFVRRLSSSLKRGDILLWNPPLSCRWMTPHCFSRMQEWTSTSPSS